MWGNYLNPKVAGIMPYVPKQIRDSRRIQKYHQNTSGVTLQPDIPPPLKGHIFQSNNDCKNLSVQHRRNTNITRKGTKSPPQTAWPAIIEPSIFTFNQGEEGAFHNTIVTSLTLRQCVETAKESRKEGSNDKHFSTKALPKITIKEWRCIADMKSYLLPRHSLAKQKPL